VAATPKTNKRSQQIVTALLDRQGRTFADEAGITLADKPAPLYQLLVLATLLSARISAGVAVAAARELFAAGYRTPRRMLDASWQDRVDALGRGHYRRYDERTATMLGDAAQLCLDRWRGDLRRLHDEATGDPDGLRERLTAFPGIGPTGADIFLREAQGAWTDIAPYVDRKVLDGAERLHLPTTPDALAALVPEKQLPDFLSALVRIARDRKAAAAVTNTKGR
jgi:endonuclease III